ncbi:MAG: Gfo/Idh/MocA family oxidoreductase [Spirochaetales bacterium]|nr:Gfo/Idh/MocA family oxidoreductase [Spirochaetales bacterium]MCF7938714.1 Gfo/Idh/MocA family oxidoreductase [Spirochaetales bacterium]
MGLGRKLKYGMVGGGPDAFIGGVHRRAAALDGNIELVAGAFSSKPDKSKQQGEALFIDPNRVYGSYEEMAEKEAKLPEGERIDFVSIVTPNFMHYPVAKVFLSKGFHVVCDKPMTTTVEEAQELVDLVKKNDLVFALTHNYTGYPMVKQAREMIKNGEIGEIRKVVVEYPQGWLSSDLDAQGDKQASWRTDPSKAGISSCMGDLGSHAENLAHYITGLEIEELIADMTTFVPGRRLEDDGNVLLKFKGGAKGILYASQISNGEENNLRIRIYGTKAGLEWHQENPNYLYRLKFDGPHETYTRGSGYLYESIGNYTRIPFGHPEGFIEAFANVYQNAASTIGKRLSGEKPNEIDLDFPTVEDGLYGVKFITRTVESGKAQKWIKFD